MAQKKHAQQMLGHALRLAKSPVLGPKEIPTLFKLSNLRYSALAAEKGVNRFYIKFCNPATF